jgi:tRNA (guanosine-2'-O-)-methyltransferase
MSKELINYLSEYITPERKELFEKVLSSRTRYLTVVLEDIYQPQNASAVLRSCDCFGIQDVHIIENQNQFKVNPNVTLGSTKWLNLHHYRKKEQNTLDCINHLRNQGYRIVATSPHTNDTDLENFDLGKGKTALIFGTELTGISEIVENNADEFLKIPMFGFTESFNISVSAAITLHHLNLRLRQSDINYLLKDDEKNDIHLAWLRKTIKSAALIEKKFHEDNTKAIQPPE